MTENLALQTEQLGKQYGSIWALQDCSIQLPEGSITALVGPNGAGKSTLLQLLAGLSRPTTGDTWFFDGLLRIHGLAALPLLGFVAQDHPLERGFSVPEMFTLGRKLNPSWDDQYARSLVERLAIPDNQKVGKLSGGQQAQVALAVALGKRPKVLSLDEPVASLDPLARRDFLAALMAAVAETGMTVLLSSHLLGDLERICDRLILLTNGHVRLSGALDDILASHRGLSVPTADVPTITRLFDVIDERSADRQSTLVVYSEGRIFDARWHAEPLPLEEIVLAYLGQNQYAGGSA